jgi:hypothetical protein
MIEKRPKEKENYVNNREFTTAVVTYVEDLQNSKKDSKAEPRIPEYVGECFLKIAKGIAKRPNFSRYSYKEEMVMDAVENCVRAVAKYKVATKTRSGTPNAFAYFTQICWYAFLRRIAKEKRQQEIKERFIEIADAGMFASFGEEVDADSIVERVKSKIERSEETVKEFGKKIKEKRKKNTNETSLNYFLV